VLPKLAKHLMALESHQWQHQTTTEQTKDYHQHHPT